MPNKLIFIVCAAALFAACAAGGFYGPRWFEHWRAERAIASFIPPAVPKRQLTEFSRQFNSVLAATGPKTLPDARIDRPGGESWKISDLRGRPALVNFWATWCAPCVVEMPSLERLAGRYNGRLDVVAITFEQGKSADDLSTWLKGRNLGDFAANLDTSGAFPAALDLAGIPTSFLIGSDGQILYRFEGDADWDSAAAREFFDVFLLQNR